MPTKLKPGQSRVFTIKGFADDGSEQPFTDAVVTVDPRLELTMNPDGLSGVIRLPKAAGPGLRVDVVADADIGPGAPVPVTGSDTVDTESVLAARLGIEWGDASGPVPVAAAR